MNKQTNLRKATMADVARLSGVGTMTVSRLLSGSANVSEETATKIHWAIEKLKYRPNQVARALRGHRTKTIGVIVPYLSDPFFAICAHEIDSTAKEHGYFVTVTSSNEDPEIEEKQAEEMVRRQVDGLIIIPSDSGARYLQRSEFDGMKIVTLDRPIALSSNSAVLTENREGAALGVKHLIGHGHRRIGFLGMDRRLYTMEMRYQGYLDAMNQFGLVSEPYITCGIESDFTLIMASMLSEKSSPTALFAANNLTMRGILHGLKTLKRLVPKDIAVVGFDDFDTAELLDPPLTVIRQPVRDLGKEAACLLFEQLLFERASVRKVLPVELVVRFSCGCHP